MHPAAVRQPIHASVRALLRRQAESLTQGDETRVAAQYRYLGIREQDRQTLRLDKRRPLQRLERTVFVPKSGVAARNDFVCVRLAIVSTRPYNQLSCRMIPSGSRK